MPKPTLRPIAKSYATTLRTARGQEGQPLRRECWSAVTLDGQWAFERIEEPGTPWVVTFRPRTDQAERIGQWFGTLKAAREAVERATIKLPSTYRAEHAAGAHPDNVYLDCPVCAEARFRPVP